MSVFADAYIPLSPVAPVSQVILLIVIIIVEGVLIRKQADEKISPASFWLRLVGVNVLTTLLGLLLLVPVVFLESWLLFGWGSDGSHPILWYTACLLYGLVLPWAVWLLCYHLSWRVEFWLLNRRKTFPVEDVSRISVRDSHRWSYAILAVPVTIATLWYWITIFHPL